MTVRKLIPEEFFDADTISRTCFHERFDGDETVERAKAQAEREDWGAFDEGGALMAHIINNHFEARLNGTLVAMGGVGAVSTLPEYRVSGAIRRIFERMLPERRTSGEVISCLYPFKHAFYRKFGYETVQSKTSYAFRPSALRHFRFEGKAEQFRSGGNAADYLKIYEAFSRNYNLALKRDTETMRRNYLSDTPLKGDDSPQRGRRFAYLLSEGEERIAYLCFTDRYCESAAKLAVTDCAWTKPAGFKAILGLLARFEADYGAVELDLPTDINLKLLLPDPYEIDEAKLTGHYMLRVVNVPQALGTLKGRVKEPISVEMYGDEILPENNGVWELSCDGVEKRSGKADIALSLRAFNQLICGAIDLKTVLLRGDVRLNADIARLQPVFPQSPAFITDRF